VFTYFALPKDFWEIRNEDIEGYKEEIFFNAAAIPRRKVRREGVDEDEACILGVCG
jgi:hypothetical protein